jgi:hypothetical protein
MAARDVIADEIAAHIKIYGEENWQDYFNPSLTACCKVLAYYFYCRVTGNKYDEYAAALYRNYKTTKGNGGTAHRQTFFYELSQLIETENRLLASAANALEKRAGIQAFEKFKYINTVNSLAGGDITKWNHILAMPYERILTKLLLNKTEAEYQKRYAELASPPAP